MSLFSRRSPIAAALLACTLTALPLPAAAQTKGPETPSPRAFFAQLAHVLGFAGMASWLGLDNGCQLDPSGACLREQITLDNGCKMDPDGQPLVGCSQ